MRYYRRIHRHRRDKWKTVCSWLLLLFSWALVISVAVSVGHAVWQENQPYEEEHLTEAAEPVFVINQPLPLDAQMENINALKSLRGTEPTILIYHTHTTEAYYPTEQNQYQASSPWRTTDNTKNVVAVGEALKEILETQYGFHVIHDTTDHEPPKLATAYDRSLLTMQKYHTQYPSILLFIDLHRDAYTNVTEPADFLTINGHETARLMFVVGKGEKYNEKPYFETNYALAERITNHLLSIDAKLARPIRLKTGRYNQHVSPNCLLVEVGHNANTLEQAISAMPYLAESIAYAFVQQSEKPIWVPN